MKNFFLKRWLFVVLISFSCIFYYDLVFFKEIYLGLSSSDLPKKYVVYWAKVEEPDASNEGQIYFCLSALDVDQSHKNEPRIYQIAYSKNLHKNVQNMIENIKKGSVYFGAEKTNQKRKTLNVEPVNNEQFEFKKNSKYYYIFSMPPSNSPEKTK